jgi:hypothetical protein
MNIHQFGLFVITLILAIAGLAVAGISVVMAIRLPKEQTITDYKHIPLAQTATSWGDIPGEYQRLFTKTHSFYVPSNFTDNEAFGYLNLGNIKELSVTYENVGRQIHIIENESSAEAIVFDQLQNYTVPSSSVNVSALSICPLKRWALMKAKAVSQVTLQGFYKYINQLTADWPYLQAASNVISKLYSTDAKKIALFDNIITNDLALRFWNDVIYGVSDAYNMMQFLKGNIHIAQIGKTIFPLGYLSLVEVRDIAKSALLETKVYNTLSQQVAAEMALYLNQKTPATAFFEQWLSHSIDKSPSFNFTNYLKGNYPIANFDFYQYIMLNFSVNVKPINADLFRPVDILANIGSAESTLFSTQSPYGLFSSPSVFADLFKAGSSFKLNPFIDDINLNSLNVAFKIVADKLKLTVASAYLLYLYFEQFSTYVLYKNSVTEISKQNEQIAYYLSEEMSGMLNSDVDLYLYIVTKVAHETYKAAYQANPSICNSIATDLINTSPTDSRDVIRNELCKAKGTFSLSLYSSFYMFVRNLKFYYSQSSSDELLNKLTIIPGVEKEAREGVIKNIVESTTLLSYIIKAELDVAANYKIYPITRCNQTYCMPRSMLFIQWNNRTITLRQPSTALPQVSSISLWEGVPYYSGRPSIELNEEEQRDPTYEKIFDNGTFQDMRTIYNEMSGAPLLSLSNYYRYLFREHILGSMIINISLSDMGMNGYKCDIIERPDDLGEDKEFDNVNIFDPNFAMQSRYYKESVYSKAWINQPAKIMSGSTSYEGMGKYEYVYGSPFLFYVDKDINGAYINRIGKDISSVPIHDPLMINASAPIIAYFDQILQVPVYLEITNDPINYNPGFDNYFALKANIDSDANSDYYNYKFPRTYDMTKYLRVPSFMVYSCDVIKDLSTKYSDPYDFTLAKAQCFLHADMGIKFAVANDSYTLMMDASYMIFLVVDRDTLNYGDGKSKGNIIPYMYINNLITIPSDAAIKYFKPEIIKENNDYTQHLMKWVIFAIFGAVLLAHMIIYMILITSKKVEQNDIKFESGSLKQSFPNLT